MNLGKQSLIVDSRPEALISSDIIMTFESKHTNYFGENNLTIFLSFVSSIVEIMMIDNGRK